MAENESPAREPSARGRGRGGRGRGGRGRGGNRGGSTTALAKTATTKAGRGGSRRGRAKNFSDSRVQAAYERQRHLKATYQAVAHALKPALQELAERTIDEAIQNPDKYQHANEFVPVIRQLQSNLDRKLVEHKRRLDLDLELAEHLYNADNYVAEQEFKNGFDEIEEQFFESQENRLRILNSLLDKGLAVDIVDDQYEFKVISDEHFDKEFGTYECYKDGFLVPYPSRVEGTEMWQKARDNEAAVAATVAAVPAKGRGRGRGANKRRAQEQPEGQPTPKKNTRSSDDIVGSPSLAAPAPAKGLLASAAEVEATPEGTPPESDSTPASPEPPAFVNGFTPAAIAKAQGIKLPAREKSPQLPKNISEADEYGFRIYNQRPSLREKGINSRLLAPRLFLFENWQIGFRDTTNDSSKGHTRAKRGKYLDTPNSNGFHFDHWCNGYDYSNTTPDDFDKDTVKRYGVHPKYGVILPGQSPVEAEKTPHVMPGKPVVYIANPSGRISHASRSFLKTTNHRRSEDNPWRAKVGASMRRFCKLDDIDPDDISVSDYLRPDEELQSMSLGTAVKELEARPVVSEESSDSEEPELEEEASPQPEAGFTDLSVLTYAGAFLEAQDSNKVPRPAPKPARYDAIRDVFTDSKPAAPPKPDTSSSIGLDLLAELSLVVSASDDPAPVKEMVQVHDNAAAPEPAIHYEPTTTHEPVLIHDPVAIQEQSAYRDAPVPVVAHANYEADHRNSFARGNEFPPVNQAQVPIDPRYNPVEVPQGYMHQPRTQPSMQPSGPVHGHPSDAMSYPPIHEHAVPQHPSVRPSEYPPQPPPQGSAMQDQGVYLSHSGYPNPPNPDHRDAHMAAGRPIDPGYPPRRMSAYATEAPSYSRSYWSQPPPPGLPPGQPAGAQVPSVPAPGPGPSHYHSPAPPPARTPFSHNASAEPLPPLRPPRGRNQSLQDETLLEPSLRSASHSNIGGSYYPPAPPRNYHRGYPGGPEPHAQLQPIATDRILPNPQTTGQGYMTSPHQGYAHQVLSPTYANPPPMHPHMAQSPQDNPQGLPNSVHRHRSTPSGSSDAGNKYRKLQPAPVPAHRAWPNKPELKTIPYDHKETGSAAALPSSGPTQIRVGTNGPDALGEKIAVVVEEENPNKRRLRPRKRKNTETEPVETEPQPVVKKARTIKPVKANSAEMEPTKGFSQPTPFPAPPPAPSKNEEAPVKIDLARKARANGKQPVVITIESTDEESL
ncbi:hypothetical protein FZEAL_7974 [Fusarium zealandicum]|uniref:Uncharacterized protein n=1 Tax=Fusarium zealandicum TaxID=1053134 RepID=A0A8H4UEP9_9HYPO|nr:hypothetical protein FZEAL_7974 [Fusarium zealandicum]